MLRNRVDGFLVETFGLLMDSVFQDSCTSLSQPLNFQSFFRSQRYVITWVNIKAVWKMFKGFPSKFCWQVKDLLCHKWLYCKQYHWMLCWKVLTAAPYSKQLMSGGSSSSKKKLCITFLASVAE
ncbi:hypothetical protein AVEN_40499-1 [Araneus ventricosus]|uniref:Uncharacterized protein n=1 Tax=Araneus ventricosus TaxID=182803 RepID=A0A4Y2IKC9_ARAVE|nr:hypothetical protein AVEN_40499-1 [Araneus ventricosus]